MKTKENTTLQPEQAIDMEQLHKIMDEVAKKNILTEKEKEARKYTLVASEEVKRHILENTEKAEKKPSK